MEDLVCVAESICSCVCVGSVGSVGCEDWNLLCMHEVTDQLLLVLHALPHNCILYICLWTSATMRLKATERQIRRQTQAAGATIMHSVRRRRTRDNVKIGKLEIGTTRWRRQLHTIYNWMCVRLLWKIISSKVTICDEVKWSETNIAPASLRDGSRSTQNTRGPAVSANICP